MEADIEPGAMMGERVTAWRGVHVRAGASVGDDTVLGQYVYVGPGARIGARCRIQNGAYIYEPAVLGDGVFIGPRVVLTNDEYPRAIRPDDTPVTTEDWTPVGVVIGHGAAIGAGAICVAPVTIGEWALVAAGSVVVTDVPDFALMAGVPARRRGWVGRAGVPLEEVGPGEWRCPRTGEQYFEEPDDMETKLHRALTS